MDAKHRTGADARAAERVDERVDERVAPGPPFDQEGDFATEHSLPSSDPRHGPAKAGRRGLRRLRLRART